MWPLVRGFQTSEQYSRIGRTYDLKAMDQILGELDLIVRSSCMERKWADLQMFLICGSKLS